MYIQNTMIPMLRLGEMYLIAAESESETLNINTATAEQLQKLPKIGPKTAEKIIAYRSEHGAFESVSELVNVSGIGEKTLESLWDLVTTGG